MAIPVVYNLRSVKERWTSAVVAVLGIAGTVGVFIAMFRWLSGSRRRWFLPAPMTMRWSGAPARHQRWTAVFLSTRSKLWKTFPAWPTRTAARS